MKRIIIFEKRSQAQAIVPHIAKGTIPDDAKFGRAFEFEDKYGNSCTAVWTNGHALRDLDPKEIQGMEKSQRFPVYPDYAKLDMVPNAPIGAYAAGAKLNADQQKDLEWKTTQVEHLCNLIRAAGEGSQIVIATDPGNEGELIGQELIQHALKDRSSWPQVKRLWASDLTAPTIQKAYEPANLKDAKETLPFALAAHVRKDFDAAFGINLTRAGWTFNKGAFRETSIGAKSDNKYISGNNFVAGRVKNTAMQVFSDLVEETQKAVKVAPPAVLFEIKGKNGETLKFRSNALKSPAAARKLQAEIQSAVDAGKPLPIDYKFDAGAKKAASMEGFNQTTLQMHMSKHFGWEPQETYKVSCQLYEMGCLSYPRTASKNLEEGHFRRHYQSIQENAKRLRLQSPEASDFPLNGNKLASSVENNSKIEDSHPALYIAKNLPTDKLDEKQRILAETVLRNNIAVYGSAPEVKTGKASIKIGKNTFHTTIAVIENPGSAKYMPESYGKLMPKGSETSFTEGMVQAPVVGKWLEHQPPILTDSLCLAIMEQNQLGTPATRGDIFSELKSAGMLTPATSATPGNEPVLQIGAQVPKVLAELNAATPGITSLDRYKERNDEYAAIAKRKMGANPYDEYASALQENRYKAAKEINKTLTTWATNVGYRGFKLKSDNLTFDKPKMGPRAVEFNNPQAISTAIA